MSTGLTIVGCFASGTIKRLVELVSSPAVKQYALRTGLQDDIRKLRGSLVKIDALLSIAEGKRAEVSGRLDEQLRELKDAVYDAEDLLEEFEYEVLRVKMESDNPQMNPGAGLQKKRKRRRKRGRGKEGKKLHSVNAADAASKVREIRARLDMLDDEVSPILDRLPADVTATPQGIPDHRQTSSFLHISDQFVGRDEEIQKIIDSLLNSVEEGSGSNNMKNPRVLPIVGLGGVGKTALAQHVYNHDTIQNHFELKMWVCVSENFEVKRLTCDIIEAACKQRPNIASLDALQHTLKEKILRKRFLLVLDDLWSEDRAKWERLCAPLAFGSQESKILVTTRSEKIASIICTIHPVLLEGLAEEEYRAFFRSCAFGSRSYEDHPKLVAIGKVIANRLRGSPLAAKTLGRLLSVQFDEKYWESIMHSEIWQLRQDQNDIMPVLELSYRQLPGQLKQCFAYCSLFLKDYKFEELQLVKMWMAQGFIKADASERPEDVGSYYVQDLVFRSFFQQQQQKYSKPDFVIHDLLHDMAQYVSKEECRRMEDVMSESIPCTIRHLSSILYTNGWKLLTLKNMCEFKKLRTLVLRGTAILDYNSCQALHEFFVELTSIRVLVLQKCGLKELPESIGNLKHLRYLDVSWNKNMVMLPESLCHLYNLQLLDVTGCRIKSVPGDISKLISLRHLSAADHVISQIGGIGKLTSLQELNMNYEVKKEDGHKIIELRDMNQLRGRLRITNLENVENKNDAISGANLRDKLHIDELHLSWSSSRSDDPNPNLPIDDEEVLEGLEPPPNIKSLDIDGYGGVGFPSWSNIQHLSNLKSLRFWNCRSLDCWERLVLLLGQLVSLERLEICECPKLGSSQLQPTQGDDDQEDAFPSLRELTIRECPKLRNISIHLPLSLATLSIANCKELTSMPVERLKHLVSLEKLEILMCPELGSSVVLAQQQVDEEEDHHGGGGGGGDNSNNNIQLLPSSLKYLDFLSCGQLIRWIPLPRCLLNLTSLTYLGIADCPHITSLPRREVMRQLTALEYLYLYDCQELMTLEGLQALPSLQRLFIWKCPKLVLAAASSQLHPAQGDDDREDAFPSLVHLTVDDTSMLTLQPLRGRLRFLLELWISNSLQSAMFSGAEEQAVLQDLTSLGRLYIIGCKNLLSLPPELHTLSSLGQLYIQNCSEIQSLPEKGLPTSLTSLVMTECHPVLKERCQKETGPDWHKISHIEYARIA